MIGHGDTVIIGLSGGADSVCLFLLLNKIRQDIGFNIHAVHVNHCIRGESADSDELFSKELCERYNVPFRSYHIDVKSLAIKNGLTLEEAGRNARYEVFSNYVKELRVAEQKEADHSNQVEAYKNVKIAVAHHMDDQAETVIFNMSRGSGLKGMSGMSPVSERKTAEEKISIIRPLLCITKEEILKYLESIKQDYCTDETNAENDYSRNQIRNIIVPGLLEIQPRTSEHISKMAEDVRMALEYIDDEIKKLYESAVIVGEDTINPEESVNETNNESKSLEERHSSCIKVRVKDIKDLNPFIAKELIICVLRNMISTYKDITKTHINDVYGLLTKGRGKRIILPYKITVEKEKEYIVFKRDRNEI